MIMEQTYSHMITLLIIYRLQIYVIYIYIHPWVKNIMTVFTRYNAYMHV